MDRYVGIDTHADLMRTLGVQTLGLPLEFHHIDSHNEMYNADGSIDADDLEYPIVDADFDVIMAVSLFTHCNAADVRANLAEMRNRIDANGVLLFTAFIDETVPDKWWFVDPERPLFQVVYGSDYLAALLAETGWRIRHVADRIYTPEQITELRQIAGPGYPVVPASGPQQVVVAVPDSV